MEVPVENGRGTDQQIETSVTILDHNGKSIATLSKKSHNCGLCRVGQGKIGADDSQARFMAAGFSLFVSCGLFGACVGGQVVDAQEVPFGIRAVRWDANTGFYINGAHLRLRGWGQRPTDEWPGLGDAQPDWLHFYTLDLMKEAGANWVRWGHCAGGPAQIESCDRLGLMVEQPGVDG